MDISSNKSGCKELQILRTIAQTPRAISIEIAIYLGNVSLVWLNLESMDGVLDGLFEYACEFFKNSQCYSKTSLFKHTEILRLLLDRGVDPAANDNRVLRWACADGHMDIVRLLLELPLVRCAAFDKESLRSASKNGHTKIVRLLLALPPERGVNPGAQNNFAFQSACQFGHSEIVRMLLDLPLNRGVAANDNAALRMANAGRKFFVYSSICHWREEHFEKRNVGNNVVIQLAQGQQS
jgi:ankyrin repeat protein